MLFFWTDSRDVLCWIQSDHRRYSKFVGARVGEILENTELSEWFWIPTKLNVADEGTKWQRIPDLSSSSRWFKGPDFMWQQQSAWPNQPTSYGTTTTERNVSVNNHAERTLVLNFTKYSNWRKLLRVTAYVLRFTRNIKARLQNQSCFTGILKESELVEAERCIYRQAQLEVSILKKSEGVNGRTVAPVPKSSHSINFHHF